MAQKVAGSFQENNPGSRTVTHKTMEIKSNVKGVSEVPTSMTPQKGVGVGNVTKGKMEDNRKLGTHY